MIEPSKNRAAFLIRDALLVCAGLFGFVFLLHLIFVRFLNYDELSHEHMVWLVSIGEVPYRDFAANHFPFLWILISPLMRVLPESPVTLDVLRVLALLFNAVFLAAFGMLICVEQPVRQRIWAIACLGLIVFSPFAMQEWIEFRPDAFANAFLFSALVLVKPGRTTCPLTGFVAGFFVGFTVLVNTKYLLFPFVLGCIALVVHARRIRFVWLFALTICLGFSAALIGGVLLLVKMNISLVNAWQMVVAYNGVVEKAHSFGFGLARALTEHPVWLGYGLIGLIGCVEMFIRQRRLPELLTVAICIFLVADLITTTRPWRQYAISWLVLAAYFPARSLPLILSRLGPRSQVGTAFVMSAMVIGFAYRGFDDPNAVGLDRPMQNRLIEWVCRRVPPDGFVAASFFYHPVFRRDTFFKTVYDMQQNGNDGIEAIMPQVAGSPYAEHFQLSGYAKELAARPPSVIVLNAKYTSAQGDALNAYLVRHPSLYEKVNIPGTTLFVLEHKVDSPSEMK